MRTVLLRALLGVATLSACRSPARAPAPTTVTETAAPVVFPLRLERCEYPVDAPLAGHRAVSAHVANSGASRIRHLHLTVVGDAARSLVVQWNTDPDDLRSVVRVRPREGGTWQRAEGYSFPLPGATHVRHHEVHLCALTPATAYEYEVGDDDGATPWRFRTAPDGPGEVTALVVGDARTHPEVWGAIAAAAVREAPDVLLFTGDAVADGGSFALWSRFFDAAETLLASTPGYWADGNHEGLAAVYYDQFALPSNGERSHHEHWYASTYGPLRLVALNDVTVPAADIAGAQRDFLDATLRAVDRARTPWIVTMHHQPMHTDAVGHLPDAITRRTWGPLFDRARVDVDLSGHVHNYESSEPLHHDGTVVAEGRGTRYFVYGGAGAPLYDFHARAPWVHQRAVTHGYALLRARADRLVWDARRVDGTVIERVEIPWTAPVAGAR